MRSGRKGAIRERGAWVMHRLAMKESPAWRALPDNARRLLDRLELEHMQHGGSQNGSLVCTYGQFAGAGIRRASVALAIRQAVALGFLEITQAGYRTAAEFRAPNLFRLTYVHGRLKNTDPTDEWEAIKGHDEAASALAAASVQRRDAGQPPARRCRQLDRNIEGRRGAAPSRPALVSPSARLDLDDS